MELKFSTIILIVLQLVPVILCVNDIENLNDTKVAYLSLDNKNLDSNLFVEDIRNFSSIVRINEILNIFSIQEIGYQWSKINGKISDACSRDMMEYLKGLENGDVWAMKSK